MAGYPVLFDGQLAVGPPLHQFLAARGPGREPVDWMCPREYEPAERGETETCCRPSHNQLWKAERHHELCRRSGGKPRGLLEKLVPALCCFAPALDLARLGLLLSISKWTVVGAPGLTRDILLRAARAAVERTNGTTSCSARVNDLVIEAHFVGMGRFNFS